MGKTASSILAASVALLLLTGGCSGGPAGTAATATRPAGAANKPTPTAATAATNAPSGQLKEALTAKEAFAVADPAAKAIHASYRLFEVWGCTASALDYEKDEHLVNGGCATWAFRYTRPAKPGSFEGYYELLLWVGPRGIVKQQETLKEKAAAVVAKGAADDWKLDSTQAIEIAEREGGKEHRLQNPKWDAGRFDSDPNAVLRASLEFVPYFDVTYAKGKEIAGAKSVVWTIKYPPVDRYVFVIDAYNGQLLLKGDAKAKP